MRGDEALNIQEKEGSKRKRMRGDEALNIQEKEGSKRKRMRGMNL